MAYADKDQGSSRMVSIALVAIVHVVVGYALVTGLAYDAVKHVVSDMSTFDVQDEPPPPEEEPPPPPPDQPLPPPPVVSPPPIVRTATPPPVTIATVATPPPVFVPTPIAPPAPPAPPAPAPEPTTISKAAGARGDPAQWVTTDDYPAGALRREEQGTTAVSWTINAQGRVENCQVTSSSGSNELDQAVCRLLVRRGRYSPALNAAGNPVPQRSSRRVVWRLPDR